MKTKNKVIVFLISHLIFLSASLFSQTDSRQIQEQQNVQQVTLENGLQVFLLENNSDALVHINIIFKAGFSNQTKETNGFFKLFTKTELFRLQPLKSHFQMQSVFLIFHHIH